jgi:hypothetical protein
VPQCIVTKPADRSSTAIAKPISSLHSDVTNALALPNKTQQADSRHRACEQRSYTTASWKSVLATRDVVSSCESQLRQVTLRRLFPTPLQLRTDRVRDEIVSRPRHVVQLRLFIHHTFGIRLASASVSGLVEAKTDGDVMGVHVHCSDVRYAVIQASNNKDRPERLVIAYQDEDCLRDLIAAPSIFGLGFASREEAIANLEIFASTVAPSKQKPRITAMFHATHENGDLASWHILVKHRGILQSILQPALAAVIALFYSKNIVSVVIRMMLGASF